MSRHRGNLAAIRLARTLAPKQFAALGRAGKLYYGKNLIAWLEMPWFRKRPAVWAEARLLAADLFSSMQKIDGREALDLVLQVAYDQSAG